MSRRRKRAAAAAVLIAISRKQRRKKARKRIWVKEWIARRPTLGAYTMLLDELRSEDPNKLKKFLRMSENDFTFLLDLVSDKISKLDTNMRESIKARERLPFWFFVFLFYLCKFLILFATTPEILQNNLLNQSCLPLTKHVSSPFCKLNKTCTVHLHKTFNNAEVNRNFLECSPTLFKRASDYCRDYFPPLLWLAGRALSDTVYISQVIGSTLSDINLR